MIEIANNSKYQSDYDVVAKMLKEAKQKQQNGDKDKVSYDKRGYRIPIRDKHSTPTTPIYFSKRGSYAKLPEKFTDLSPVLPPINSDGKIGAFKQGIRAADCYLLSSLISLRNNTRTAKILKKNIKKNSDGSFTITLPGAQIIKKNNKEDNIKSYITGEYTITPQEFYRARQSVSYSSGDDDVLLYELAFEKYRDEVEKTDLENNLPVKGNQSGIYTGRDSLRILDGGISTDAIFVLTGKRGERLCIKGNENSSISCWELQRVTTELTFKDIDNINKYLDKLQEKPQEYVATASFNIKEGGSHSVSIKSVTDKSVILVDPYNSEKEIVITKEEFIKKVRSIDLVNINNNSTNEDESLFGKILSPIIDVIKKFGQFISSLF